MNLSIKVTRKGPRLPELAEKFYGPALAQAINKTILAIQAQQRAKIPTQLTLRTAASRRLIHNLVYIGKKDFASDKQRRYTGRVTLNGENASEGVRRFAPRIVRFEFGGVETSDGIPLYVPTKALRRSPGAAIRRELYPKALGLLEARQIEGGTAFRALGKSRKTGVHKTGRGKLQLKGKRRTFAIDPRFTPGARGFGVWQRRGVAIRVNHGPSLGLGSETYKIWNYVTQIRYPKRLTFREDSAQIASEMHVLLRAELEKRTNRSLVKGAR